MRTAKKNSAKATRSRKTARRVTASATEMSQLAQQFRDMTALLERLRLSELSALVSELSRARARRPLPEYAKVVAVGKSDDVCDVRGRGGIVLDSAENGGRWTYTVYFPFCQEALILQEASLWDTGETIPEDVTTGVAPGVACESTRMGKALPWRNESCGRRSP
jgi:hypothetical protein